MALTRPLDCAALEQGMLAQTRPDVVVDISEDALNKMLADAVRGNDVALMKQAIAWGADPRAQIDITTPQDMEQTESDFMENGPRPAIVPQQPLIIIALQGKADLALERLLDMGLDANTLDINEIPALTAWATFLPFKDDAEKKRWQRCGTLLLNAGADPRLGYGGTRRSNGSLLHIMKATSGTLAIRMAKATKEVFDAFQAEQLRKQLDANTPQTASTQPRTKAARL